MFFNFKKGQISQGLCLLFLIVVISGVVGFIQFREIRSDILLINELLTKQKNDLLGVKTEVNLLQVVNKESLAKLELDLLTEKEKRVSLEESQAQQKVLSQQQISSLEKKIAETSEGELTQVVNKWSPYVVALECNFYNTSTGQLILQSNGSGLLVNWKGSILILTNRHVITAVALDRNDLANECVIKFPQQETSFLSSDLSVFGGDFDWGVVTLNSPNNYVKSVLKNSPVLCSQTPALGDGVVILGYPSIGDQKNVTATEGIIAGFDGSYFITSAKVEKGNSGGAAISLKNNCYLGTPTFSRTGEIESLARILDVRVLK